MFTLVVVSIAAWSAYGHLRFKTPEDNHYNDCKVIEAFELECEKLVSEVPISLTKEDHISELPSDVLSNIMARLSLRDVVRMTTISRYWRNVCLRCPFLKMDWRVMFGYDRFIHEKNCINYNTAYVRSVDQVLQQRKDQNILSFHLSFCLNYNKYACDIDRWISFAAANKRLESLRLEFICSDYDRPVLKFDPGDHYVVKDSWLGQFPYLRDLRLGTCILEFQSEYRFNNIVTLNLSYVTLKGVEWQNIVSTSTSMKWLRLSGCNVPEKLCISKNLECLSFLVIENCCGLVEIQIHAMNLKTFELCAIETIECSFSDASKLESLYVFFAVRGVHKAKDMFRDLVENMPNLKHLSLRVDSFEMHKVPFAKSSAFGSVLNLNLFMRFEDPDVDIIMNLCRILQFFPQLEKLSIGMPPSFRNKKDEYLAPSFHTKLKEIKLYHFMEGWIGFANFLLRSAVVLDCMIVKSYFKYYMGCGEWIYSRRQWFKGESKRISEALKGKAISPTAKVVIVDGRCKCNNESCMYAN